MQNRGQNKRTGRQRLLSLAFLALAIVLWLVLGGGDGEKAGGQPALTVAPTAVTTATNRTDALAATKAPARSQSKATAGKTGTPAPQKTAEPKDAIDIDGAYTTKADVALYIHTYGKLPHNFITKKEARALGWQGGDLRYFKQDACIGGDRFGNYEGSLPARKGRVYYECDIDTLGAASRGAKRIVFSNDGLIYYTGDHYETFELLYGGKE